MNSNRRISIAFIGIFLFVSAQLLWWNILFARHIGANTRLQLEQWRREQLMMQLFYAQATPQQKRDFPALCKRLYRHLRCVAPRFELRPKAQQLVLHNDWRYRRMFLLEGATFFLFFIGGLYLLWLGIRAEQELKLRQQNFLSAVSHEMRTPISTMRLLLETLLMRDFSPDKQERYLQRLVKQVDRLQHTSEQVVAAAMLDTGATRSLSDDELNDQIEEILEHSRGVLEERGARILWQPSPDEILVSLEPRALSLIVHNLVENAVKYNPKADKEVRVSVRRDGDMAQVWVEDNGAGIPQEEREKVFTPFYRVGEELTRDKDGLGLGLYLVKGLTEAMHGSVSYVALDEGSRFVLQWPALPPKEQVR